MSGLVQHVGAFWRDESGATAIEYALIASLVSVAIIGSVVLMRDELVATYTYIQESVAEARAE